MRIRTQMDKTPLRRIAAGNVRFSRANLISDRFRFAYSETACVRLACFSTMAAHSKE